jgi:peptidoglycan biosynthesis protein MviN/MurJ (putative lipid II flippase)
MLRATAGTWINYATTLLFQVVFAGRFGISQEAAAFVVAFGLAVAVGSIFANTIQGIAVPRLIAEDGATLERGTLRFLAILAAIAAVVCGVFACVGGLIAGVMAPALNLETETLRSLLYVTAGAIFLLVLNNEMIAVSLARGQRVLPAVGNAVPSICATLALLLVPGAGVVDVYLAFMAGVGLEALLLLLALTRRPVIVTGEALATAGIGTTAASTLFVFVLYAMITPAEGIAASLGAHGGAAQYYYASRGLAVAQQLIIGGAALVALADWSLLARSTDRRHLARVLVTGTVVAGILLIGAASFAAVAGRDIVRFVFEHGSFTSSDSQTVARVLMLALPGFCGEGLSQIMSRALFATHNNRTIVGVGLANFAARMTLILALGPIFGPEGVAAAYSITWLGVAGALFVILTRKQLLYWNLPIVGKGFAVSAGTAATAVVVALLAPGPVLLNGGLVLAVFATLFLAARPVGLWRSLWQP